MGSPYEGTQRRSDEAWHRRRIDRSFAIATTTVTVAQYQRCLQAHPDVRHVHPRDYGPTPHGPAMAPNWYEAIQYCRWLSEQEQVPEDQMCYPSVAEIEKSKDGLARLQLPPDALSRTGYRLPTEAEWEFACRAGAETTRFFGHGEDLLGSYAWYAPNSMDRTWPVGQKVPTIWVCSTCMGASGSGARTKYLPYPTDREGRPIQDDSGRNEVLGDGSRALRGGTFCSAFPQYDRPTYRFLTFDFRVARTYR